MARPVGEARRGLIAAAELGASITVRTEDATLSLPAPAEYGCEAPGRNSRSKEAALSGL